MKNAVFIIAVFSLLPLNLSAQSGEELFKSICSSCHTINKGKLVGPDLSGVYNKQDNAWLINFIKSSQKMVKAGDPAAVAIFNEFKIPMPDNNLSEKQINSIIDYIKQTDQSSQPSAEKQATPVDTSGAAGTQKDTTKTGAIAQSQAAAPKDTISVSDSMVITGRSYFNGTMPFANGAAPCMSCHNVNDGSFIGGGKLARDLTTAYSRLSPAGVSGILNNPPFPVMKMAIPGPLTPEELSDLISYLKSSDGNSSYVFRFPGGLIIFVVAFVAAIFLMVFITLLYDVRKIPEGFVLKD